MDEKKIHDQYPKNKNTGNSLDMLGVGRTPPHSIELEEAVLGAIMLEKEALNLIIDLLKPEMFYRNDHQKIYKAIVDLFHASEPVDIQMVTNKLRVNGELENIGGPYKVAELTMRVGSAANIESHSRIIIEKYLLREMISISSTISRDAYEDTTDVFELLDKTSQGIFTISESNIRRNYSDLPTLLDLAISNLEKLKDQKGGLTGIGSGFSQLDRITCGWQKAELVIIAGRPSMGKTAFMVSLARNAAINFHAPVAIFSLEMSSLQLVNRLVSAETELAGDLLKKGNLAEHEWQQLQSRIVPLTKASIFIDDTPGISLLEIRAKARRLKSTQNISMIIIDYLQMMSGQNQNRGFQMNREQEIATISRSMKALAKELDVPVLVLSQLNRDPDKRGGNRTPFLSDLRESGSIEQDADMVIFLHRLEYYGIFTDTDGNPTNGICDVIIAKNRNGSTGTVKLRFLQRFTKFVDFESSDIGSFDNVEDNETTTKKVITRQSRMNKKSSLDTSSIEDIGKENDTNGTPF